MRIVEIFFAKAERGHPLKLLLTYLHTVVVVKIFTTNFLQLLACEATSQLRVKRIFGLNYTTPVSEAAVSRMSHFVVYDLRHIVS